MWDVRYEDLDMADVGPYAAIGATQYYDDKKEDKPAAYVFEDFVYRNIYVERSGVAKHSYAVDFACNDRHGPQCRNFALDNVTFEHSGGMHCRGVQGTATGVKGIDSCLGSTTFV